MYRSRYARCSEMVIVPIWPYPRLSCGPLCWLKPWIRQCSYMKLKWKFDSEKCCAHYIHVRYVKRCNRRWIDSVDPHKNCPRTLSFRPPVRSNGRSYKMLVMFFFPTRYLRAPSADHRETSPHDRSLCLFYKLTPKIRGALPSPKKWGPETCKISVDFI